MSTTTSTNNNNVIIVPLIDFASRLNKFIDHVHSLQEKVSRVRWLFYWFTMISQLLMIFMAMGIAVIGVVFPGVAEVSYISSSFAFVIAGMKTFLISFDTASKLSNAESMLNQIRKILLQVYQIQQDVAEKKNEDGQDQVNFQAAQNQFLLLCNSYDTFLDSILISVSNLAEAPQPNVAVATA